MSQTRQFRFFLFLFSVLSAFIEGQTLRDLESNLSSFVLETKKIEIPGYPDAFNPCIIRWKGSILMSFRIRDPLTLLTDQIGLIWLDDDLNVQSDPHILQMNIDHSPADRTQDPRLVEVNSDLYITYNEFHPTSSGSFNRRMVYSKLIEENDLFFTVSPYPLLSFEGEDPKKQEKNWVPFDYNSNLLFSYSVNPQLTFFPLYESNTCITFSSTSANLKWNWGILRGGTPAINIGTEYLAFFHSVKDMVSLQSDGNRIIHYFMGAYTFNPEPPFTVTKISQEPIIGQNFYHGPLYDTWKPLLAVFPMGFVHDDNYIWISYGRQDHESWIVKVDKKALLDSLVKVSDPS